MMVVVSGFRTLFCMLRLSVLYHQFTKGMMGSIMHQNLPIPSYEILLIYLTFLVMQ